MNVHQQIEKIRETIDGNNGDGLKSRLARIEENLKGHIAFDKQFQTDVKAYHDKTQRWLIILSIAAGGSPLASMLVEFFMK